MRIASKSVLDGADHDLRQELLDKLIDSRLVGPSMQVCQVPSRLPMRELPHGNWMNMFLLYTAYAKSKHETPASRSTFFSVIQDWKVCIKFHRRTHHKISYVQQTQVQYSKCHWTLPYWGEFLFMIFWKFLKHICSWSVVSLDFRRQKHSKTGTSMNLNIFCSYSSVPGCQCLYPILRWVAGALYRGLEGSPNVLPSKRQGKEPKWLVSHYTGQLW